MPYPHTAAFSRHEFLQAGFSGLLGLGLADVLSARDTSPQRPAAKAATPASGGAAKSVILVFQTGAPAHQDIWDLKPDAPVEVRGEFSPIQTSVPGIQICEHLPKLAQQMARFAIIRSLVGAKNEHASELCLCRILSVGCPALADLASFQTPNITKNLEICHSCETILCARFRRAQSIPIKFLRDLSEDMSTGWILSLW